MNRQKSTVIKGMAILMLILYHFPRVLGPAAYSPQLQAFICNAFHPFLYFFMITGYGLFTAYRDGRLTWTYLFKRTLRLYITYWLVLILFAVCLGSWMYPDRFPMDPLTVLGNFIGWRWDYSQYTWFLLPYFLITLASPWIFKCMDKLGNILSIVVSFVISMGMTWLIGKFYESFFCHHIVIYLVVLALQMLMGIVAGAVLARYYLSGHELTWSKLRGKNALVWLLLVVVFLLKGHPIINMIPYLSVVILWLILHLDPTKFGQYILTPVGNMGMVMWLSHGFLGVRLFNDFFMQFKWAPLIWLAWILACYAVACLVMPVSNRISKALKLKK